jgi:hypothetical protein
MILEKKWACNHFRMKKENSRNGGDPIFQGD